MLDARDARRSRQLRLAEEYPDATTVVMTVVAPGAQKRNRCTLAVASAGTEALMKALDGTLLMQETNDAPTGYELFAVTSLPPLEAKLLAADIEDTHPLGRLMDIDVIGRDLTPVSRTAIGRPGRTCLICGRDARVCMRTGAHTYAELLARIAKMVDDYGRDL